MKHQKTFIVDILFVLALFILFTASALMVVCIGTEVYRQTTEDMTKNYDMRTSIAYITEKIRQNDCLISSDDGSVSSNIAVTSLYGEQALVLTQKIGDEYYDTYLYLYDGHLKELLIKSGNNLGEHTLSAGQDILQLSDFRINQASHNLFSIEFTTPDNEVHKLFVSTHCQ